MKKVNLFLGLLLAAISLTSCSNDDNDSTNTELTEANLLGKWVLTSLIENGETYELDDCEKLDVLELEANGIFSTTSYTEVTNTDASGNEVTECEVLFDFTGSWKLENDILTSVVNGFSAESKIINFSGNEVTFESTMETIDSEGNTISETNVGTYRKEQ